MANWLTDMLNARCNQPVEARGAVTRAHADQLAEKLASAPVSLEDWQQQQQHIAGLRAIADREDGQPVYAEVDGVIVDLASPEYAAWWHAQYGS